MYDLWLQDLLRTMPKGKTQQGLADHLGLSQSQVSRMARGERRIRAAEIERICQYLGIERSGRPLTSLTDETTAAHFGSLVVVMGVIANKVWRETAPLVAEDVKVPAVPDPRYAGVRQYAMLVESPFEPHSRPGEFAVFAAFEDVRDAPLRGDLVHVVQRRDGLEEHTLRMVEIADGRIRLASPGSIQIDWRRSGHPPESVELRGLFLTSYRPPR